MNIQDALLCASVNFKKWAVNARIYVLFALLLLFTVWDFSGIYAYALKVGYSVSPWMFPHLFMMPAAVPIYGCFAILLFCDAPFIDSHMPFLMVRTGRNSWILGQLLYILMASLLYTIINYLITVIAFFPIIDFTSDWGKVLRTLATDLSSATNMGIHLTAVVSGSIVSSYSAIDATLISLGLFFLVTFFTGIVIFSLNLITRKPIGIIVAGIFVFISYFCIYVGTLTIGLKVYYFSPLSWSSLLFIDWSGSGDSPSFAYAIAFLIASTLVLSIFSIATFAKRDVDLTEGSE